MRYLTCFPIVCAALVTMTLMQFGCASPQNPVAAGIKLAAPKTSALQSTLKEVACGKADCGCQGKDIEDLNKRGGRRVVFRIGSLTGASYRIQTVGSSEGVGGAYGAGSGFSSERGERKLQIRHHCFRSDLAPGKHALSVHFSEDRGAFLEISEVVVHDSVGALEGFFIFGDKDGQAMVLDSNVLETWLTEQRLSQLEHRKAEPAAITASDIRYTRQKQEDDRAVLTMNVVINIPNAAKITSEK